MISISSPLGSLCLLSIDPHMGLQAGMEIFGFTLIVSDIFSKQDDLFSFKLTVQNIHRHKTNFNHSDTTYKMLDTLMVYFFLFSI